KGPTALRHESTGKPKIDGRVTADTAGATIVDSGEEDANAGGISRVQGDRGICGDRPAILVLDRKGRKTLRDESAGKPKIDGRATADAAAGKILDAIEEAANARN